MFRRRTVQECTAVSTVAAPPVASQLSVASLPDRDTSETRRAAKIDLFAGIGEATERNLALGKILRKAFELVDDMAAFSSDFDVTSETTRTRAAQFVASAVSLKNQNDVIEERLASAADVVERAHARSRSAILGVEDLTGAVGDIERAVSMIASIAAQTNLLALNATIEAARAGPAGAGFGVVAGEVKALSQETERATREIATTVRRIRERAHLSTTEVKEFDVLIGGLQAVFAAMRTAVEVQSEQTRGIGAGSEEIAALARTVRANAAKLQEIGATVRDMTGAAERAAADARAAFVHLTDRAAVVLSHADIGARGSRTRWPVALRTEVSLRDAIYKARVIDLSPQAIQIEVGVDFPGWALGETVAAEIDEIGRISLRLLSPTTAGFETAVIDASREIIMRVEAMMDRLRVTYQPYIDRLQAVAADVQCSLEQAVDSGRLAVVDLYDTNYRRVGTAEPPQYTTLAVPPIQACLGDRLERELAASPKPDFCILQDRNGFNIVHNLVYSHPRRIDDEAWNLRHSRMQRIFDDRAGMAASRNLQPFIVQSYVRDMGDAIETLMEFDAPVFVAGRHWGAVRMAYRLGDNADGGRRISAASA